MRATVFMRMTGMMLAGVMSMAALTACSGSSKEESASTTAETSSEGGVLRVGMECAYAPFNWTQVSPEVANGDTAVEIYGGGGYAYGYDVMVAKALAEEMGMTLEIHKVEWDSIGISMDSGDYDCIIAGMGRTAERMLSYSFTEPYYYRNNCIVVKKGSDIENITGLSELAGKNVTATTQLGTGWVPLLDQIPDVTLGANYESTAEVFMALSNETADLAVIDIPTAESALLTNTDLKIIIPKEGDTFTGDEEMTNVCIATRKDDTALRDKLQSAMDSIGLERDKMDSMMEEAISVQPAAK
ncbi:MAG: transporter substrate-binding domain-containing protein [Oscillospiraceae bacterium]|nr:transporter substrate-binding domain-containing protein [Oscillospiraceae bacterium]